MHRPRIDIFHDETESKFRHLASMCRRDKSRMTKTRIEIVELLARNREEGLYFSYLFSFLRIYNRNFSMLSQVFLFFIDDIKYICQRNEKSITNVFVYCIRICNKVYSLTVDSLKFSQEIRNSFPFEFNINLTIILNFCIFHFRDFLCLSKINIRYISLRKHEITFQK